MKSRILSRRMLLKGVGAAIALPWLEAMKPATSPISSSAPRRLAFLYVPNGMHMGDWTPRGPSDTDFELPSILEPIQRHRSAMNIISGLSLDGANAHGDGGGDHARSVASFLTGAHPRKTHGENISNGISVDQVAAQQVGHKTRFPSLELGTERSAQGGRCDSGYSCLYTSNISWRTESSPLAKEIDPAAVFARLFGGPDQRENRIARQKQESDRRSILDFVREDARILNQKLGRRDQRKLDEYLYAIRDIERRLQSSDKLEQPEQDINDYPRPEGVPVEYDQHIKLLFDMMVLAFQTDSTRIITMMYANAGSNRSYRNLGISDGHHSISHHGGSRPKQKMISRINQFHAGLLGHLLDRLAEVEEDGQPLLDQCMIVYGSGIADGNSHAHHDLPIATFGAGGGTIHTGRHIRVRRRTPLTNLYCSLLDRMGATVESFSDSTGRLSELGELGS